MLQQTTVNKLEQITLTEARASKYWKSEMYAEGDAYFQAFQRLAGGMNGEQVSALREFIGNGEFATELATVDLEDTPPDYFAGYQMLPDYSLYAEYVIHVQRFDMSTYSWKWVESDRLRVLIDGNGDTINF